MQESEKKRYYRIVIEVDIEIKKGSSVSDRIQFKSNLTKIVVRCSVDLEIAVTGFVIKLTLK